eukprot:227906-Pleurochrysis_carterae.AAC.1
MSAKASARARKSARESERRDREREEEGEEEERQRQMQKEEKIETSKSEGKREGQGGTALRVLEGCVRTEKQGWERLRAATRGERRAASLVVARARVFAPVLRAHFELVHACASLHAITQDAPFAPVRVQVCVRTGARARALCVRARVGARARGCARHALVRAGVA